MMLINLFLLSLCGLRLGISFGKPKDNIATIRARVHELSITGRMNDIIAYLENVEKEHGTLLIDDVTPSLFSYKGVALYNSLRIEEAIENLRLSVKYFPKDTRAWINLGEMQVQTFMLDEAIDSFSSALGAGDLSALPRTLRTKGWSASWENFEFLCAALERETAVCVDNLSDCRVDSAGGLEYGDIDGRASVVMNSLNPNAQASAIQIPSSDIASYWQDLKPSSHNIGKSKTLQGSPTMETRRIKVGFMSADFGVHPVAQLVRGLFQFINTSRVEVYCFSLQSKVSWWGQNISDTVEHFVWLTHMNTLDAAREVARLGIEVLIDLNGHTMHSGLTIMAHRPAPLQMSYLGLPSTTAAPFIDYYIADSIVIPPEQRAHFSEQLVLMSDCYIANDYAQMQGAVLPFSNENRAPRDTLKSPVDLSAATFLFATLSNSQKMDPAIFHVWMNILRRFPGSKMVFTEHAGSGVYMKHIRANGRGLGVETERLVSLKQIPWIDHLYTKTAFDLVLDTVVKNGHTTGLDGVWAGIPTVSLAGGVEAPARAAESIAVNLDSQLGLAYSLKEYEDIVFALAHKSRQLRRSARARVSRNAKDSKTNNGDDNSDDNASSSSSDVESQQTGAKDDGEERLRLWRKQVTEQRTISNLFDTPHYEREFTRLLQGTWELAHIARIKDAFQTSSSRKRGAHSKEQNTQGFTINSKHYNSKGLFHLFTPPSARFASPDATTDAYSSFDGTKNDGEVSTAAAPATATAVSAVSGNRDRNGNRAAGGNRDGRGRLLVHQALLEESLMGAALLLNSNSKGEGASASTNAENAEGGDDDSGGASSGTAGTGAGANNAKYEAPSKGRRHGHDHQHRHPQENEGSGRRKDRDSKQYPPLPNYIFEGRWIMLNIGGLAPAEGWLTVNAQMLGSVIKAHKVDVIRDMDDLFGFQDSSVSAIYSSHTLEHNSFGDGALEATLREWHRVMRLGGLLMVSVPDLETMARMYLDPAFGLEEQWMITRMIYGAQSDSFDYHMIGFNYALLKYFLEKTGFCEVERVGSFNLHFSDTSDMVYKGYFVSLNVVAKVCTAPTTGASATSRAPKIDDGFRVDHHASAYIPHPRT